MIFQVCQHRLGIGDQPDRALHSGGEFSDRHFELRRRRQRHPAIGRATAGHESGLRGSSSSVRRVHLHSGQQALRPWWISTFWKSEKFVFLQNCLK
jgi:hypothetical protein